MPWPLVILLVLTVLLLGSRVVRRLRMRAWVRSQSEPKDRMEAEILYQGWLRSRNTRWWWP